MENNAELVRLEQFIDTLLDKYNGLKERFHVLEETLRERDDECAGLKDGITALQNERLEVGSRVSDLLGRIEQWETEQGEQNGEGFEAENQDSSYEDGSQENG